MLEQRTLTDKIIGLAVEVHYTLVPDPVERAYAECLGLAPSHASIGFESQITVPGIYKGMIIRLSYRADIVVENTIIMEIKAVPRFAQLMTRSFCPTFV